MKKFIFSKLGIIFLTLISNFNILAQESWDFGNKYKAYVQTASPPLRIRMNSGTSLRSMGFVGKVGGVAFLQIAEPDLSMKGIQIKYDYISSNEDGSRLRIIASKDTIYPYLPDWQLVPIVKFAHSEYNSCVSLFGQKTNANAYDIIYHPAFENTLLGMRLLQSDIALMDVNTHWQLPTNNGKKILGLGEKESDKDSAMNAGEEIQTYKEQGDHESWILTDDTIEIKFFIRNNKLQFMGLPYYYFWRKDDKSRLKENEIFEKIMYTKFLYQTVKDNNGDLKGGANILSQLDTIQSQLVEKFNKLEYNPVCDEETTDLLKDEYQLFLKFNNPVYSSTLNVVHYSAFFRYLKRTNSINWTKFYNRVSSVHVYPKVKTPTTLPKNY